MILTIHRGTHQIGGSCVDLRADGGDRILLDVGMPLTRPDGSDWPRGTMTRPAKDLRAEGVLPDIMGLYADSDPQYQALFLSHAHLDHHGLAHHVHPDVPVYASRGTIEMLKASRLFVPDATVPACLRELPETGSVTTGAFTVTGIPVDHAAPDSRALLVAADGQRVLYSGDLRAHGRQRHLFNALPQAAGPVDVLVLEGTTVGQAPGAHGLADEESVERRLTELANESREFVVVVASGQNIDRAISVYRAALASGRELVIDPYQAYVLMTLREVCPDAPQYDSPSVRVKFIQSHVSKLIAAGLWPVACRMSRAAKVEARELAATPGHFICLARSSGATVALLRYLERTTRPEVVWSQWAGYLKKGGAIPRYCVDRGITPLLIHAGGHASPEDLAELARRIDPKVVVPIHTESASGLAEIIPNVQVLRDGEAVPIAALSAFSADHAR
jgi:ribonuclease J